MFNDLHIQRLLRAAPGMFVLLKADADFTIMAASNDYLLTSDSDESIVGRPLFDVFPDNPAIKGPQGSETLRKSLHKVIASAQPDRMPTVRYDVRVPSANDRKFVERYWTPLNVPIVGDDGQVELILHRVEEQVATANRRAVEILESITEGFFTLDRQWRFDYVNAEAHRILGVEPGFLKQQRIWEVYPGLEGTPFWDSYHQTMETQVKTSFTAYYALQERWYEVTAFPAPEGISVYFRNVTERKALDAQREALIDLSQRLVNAPDAIQAGYEGAAVLGTALNVGRVGFGTIDAESETLHVDRDWTAPDIVSLAGVTQLRDYGSFIDSLKNNEFIAIEDVRDDPRTASAAAALEAYSTRSFMNVPVMEQGRLVAVLFVNHTQPRQWTDAEKAFMREVALRTHTAVERARAALELQNSELRLRSVNESLEQKVEERTAALMEAEERFRQSQKMEAIGQLTGGIAHDFNNLLAGMSGSLQVLELRLTQGRYDNVRRYIGMAKDSAKRAASLTHRLLAFSRQQTLDPKPADVNRLVGNLEELIRRTVGPSVAVEVVGAGGLWSTRVDASQLENAVLNLCINARDAMAPGGGRLTIETANKWLDETAAAERDLTPGQYISLCVSDTGCGMTAETIARAFDPFFTTKPLGQGTGLGLSMVYGFVRQSGGQVRIYSELGKGTTVCLYLARQLGSDETEAGRDTHQRIEPQAHGEYILVVEDEEVIREIVVELLESQGYVVSSASTGAEALKMLDSDQKVDLLLTDVGLPGGMNGRQLAEVARKSRPALSVLFVTGYAENAIFGNGFLEHGMEVVTKPFDLEALADKVRSLIDGAARER
ncbi:response regulator [Hydrogenophaga sp.]|uniref:response regulator n=1 Tax=Hydrogenophaga sp. TaxID=1904254 RepID=UPI0027259536|nr:response regulator [Hydrogenophaga sp.]MDO9436609.1 response regulator [Hydrogenophaga sp.]